MPTETVSLFHYKQEKMTDQYRHCDEIIKTTSLELIYFLNRIDKVKMEWNGKSAYDFSSRTCLLRVCISRRPRCCLTCVLEDCLLWQPFRVCRCCAWFYRIFCEEISCFKLSLSRFFFQTLRNVHMSNGSLVFNSQITTKTTSYPHWVGLTSPL